MTALATRAPRTPIAIALHSQAWAGGTEKIGAVLCMIMLTVSAALPDDRDMPEAARTASPASSALAAPGTETTFGFYLGAPYHYPSDFKLEKKGQHDLTIKNIEWYTHPFESPLYYGARIQRWFAGGHTGTMIDFTHSKAYAPLDAKNQMQGTYDGKPVPSGTTVRDLYDKLEYSHGHNMLTLNALVRIFGFSNRIAPYAGLGAGISLPHSESHNTSDTARTYEYQYAGPNAQALAGVELRLKTGSIFVEYKFTIADYMTPVTHRDGSWLPLDLWHQFSRWWPGAEPAGGWQSTRLASHQVIGGFLVRFVPASPTPVK